MPSASCCFLLVFYFTENQYQTESKRRPNAVTLFVDFFGPQDIKRAREAPRGCSEGSTTHHGAPRGPGAPLWIVPTSGGSRSTYLLYEYPNIPETLGESMKINSSRRKFQIHQIQSRHHHGGVHHVHWCLSNDA